MGWDPDLNKKEKVRAAPAFTTEQPDVLRLTDIYHETEAYLHNRILLGCEEKLNHELGGHVDKTRRDNIE